MIKVGVGRWVFLLVPVHTCCPGQDPESRQTVVCVCSCVHVETQKHHYTKNNRIHHAIISTAGH